jgi:glycine cleavage system H protein
VSYPNDFKYSDEHEWISPDGTVGITQYAAEQVGDIVFVELPKVGDTVSAGQPFGVIESVKAVSELFAPVSGKVAAINDRLLESPETISADPHGAGWLVKVEIGDSAELARLKDAEAYEAMIAAA